MKKIILGITIAFSVLQSFAASGWVESIIRQNDIIRINASQSPTGADSWGNDLFIDKEDKVSLAIIMAAAANNNLLSYDATWDAAYGKFKMSNITIHYLQ